MHSFILLVVVGIRWTKTVKYLCRNIKFYMYLLRKDVKLYTSLARFVESEFQELLSSRIKLISFRSYKF